LAHEVEHDCWMACRLNIHCFLAILFVTNSNGAWSDRILCRGTMVVSIFLELSSHTRFVPEIFARPNIPAIFLDFIPNLLKRRIFVVGTDYMFLTEAAIGVLDVLDTVLGNWPCEANSKGPFSVPASAVGPGVPAEEWPASNHDLEKGKLWILTEVTKSNIVDHCENVSNVPELQSEWAKTLKQHVVRFKKLLHLVAAGYECVPWYTFLDIERQT
jgi:hypothetical protein